MKKLIYLLFAAFISLTMLQSCEEDVESPTFTEDDYPRILGRWPEKMGNFPGSMRGNAGVEFTHKVQFTPSNLCTGVWYVDDVEYTHGDTFTYLTDQAGNYNIKLVVTTPKYTTSREMILVIAAATN